MIIWLDAFYYLHWIFVFFQETSATLIYNWYKYMNKPQLYPLWFMLAHRVLLLASSLRSVIVSSPNDAVDPSLVWTHSSWPENNMFIQMFFSKKTLVKCEHESGHKQGPETKKDSAWAFLYRHPLRCVFGSVSTKSRCFLQFTQVAFCLLPTWKEKASICRVILKRRIASCSSEATMA